MKTIVLSDHTADVLAMRERQHNQGYDIEIARHRRESAELDRRMEEEYEGRMSAYERELVGWNAMGWVRKFADGMSRWRVLFGLCVLAKAACVLTYALMPEEWMIGAVQRWAGYTAPTRRRQSPATQSISRSSGCQV